MGGYQDISKLLEEKGYKNIKSQDGFDIYIKKTIKERDGWKKLTTKVYALVDEFPLVIWLKEKREPTDEEKRILDDGGVISLDGNLEERIKAKLEGKIKYFINKEQKKSAQAKYLKQVLDSLKNQKTTPN